MSSSPSAGNVATATGTLTRTQIETLRRLADK